MTALGALTCADAARFSRTLEDASERLVGGRMSPMSGNASVTMSSLTDVEAFLVVLSPEEVTSFNPTQRIHYVEPRLLVSWTRDIIGDLELAGALDEVVATGRVYGQLVPEIKQLIAQRLGQYDEVLAADE